MKKKPVQPPTAVTASTGVKLRCDYREEQQLEYWPRPTELQLAELAARLARTPVIDPKQLVGEAWAIYWESCRVIREDHRHVTEFFESEGRWQDSADDQAGRPMLSLPVPKRYPVSYKEAELLLLPKLKGRTADRARVMRDFLLADYIRSKMAAYGNIIVAREDSMSGEEFFKGTVAPLLAEHRPDLLWIDPALAYLGGEANSQKDVGRFLRNWLNPLLHQHACGCVVVHHTNKPPSGQEKSNWQAGVFAYLGSGSAEWANWARTVLVMRAVGSHSVFELRAGKRGPRLNWREDDGETRRYAQYIAHADQPGAICWRAADAAEVPTDTGSPQDRSKNDLLPHVPMDKPITKANRAGIALNKINGLIAELIEDGTLHEWRVRRKGTNPQRFLSRQPQPEEQLPV